MNQNLLKLVLLFLVLSSSVFSGYWLRGVLEENRQLEVARGHMASTLNLQGVVQKMSEELIKAEEEAKQLRRRKFDKAVVKYVETVGTTKCLSSPEFVQLYNSTIPTADTTK